MKVIKDAIKSIKRDLCNAEDDIKNAIQYKVDRPEDAKMFYNSSIYILNGIKTKHDQIVADIKAYRAEHGEPPEPMMFIYNYEHEGYLEQMAHIKRMQDLYNSGM